MNITLVIFQKIMTGQKIVEAGPNKYILNSAICERHEAFNLLKDQWLCFFDHDCVYSDALINQVRSQVGADHDSVKILAGLYMNPDNATILQLAHNFIANQWLLQSETESFKNLLGGFFVIYSSQKLREFKFPDFPRWGAEDQALAFFLQQQGYKIQIASDLVVVHDTSSRWSHFFRRAFYHGLNCIETNPSHFTINKIKSLFLLMKDLTRSVQLFVVLHFLILTLAKLIRPVLRKNM